MREIKQGYYTVIEEDGDYALIKRKTEFEPYIVAWGFEENGDDCTWNQGHYFQDLFKALDFMKSRTEVLHIRYDRLIELATKAIDGLFEDDRDEAMEYCLNELELEEEEIDFFGINSR